MKKGWTYKKLGEVCKRITDGSHNPPKGILSSNYLMISSQNVFNDNIKLDDVRYLSEEDFIKENKRTNIKSNDVLLTIVGTIGRCAVVNDNIGNITLQRSVAVLSPTSNINSRFLMYCCIGNNENLNKNAHGVAQRGIYLKQLCNIAIPVPSLEEQLQVVSELDLLSGVIEKQKAQLEELDKLAQSIFYETFGDPVANEKGWEVGTIGSLCSDKKNIIRANKLFKKEDLINYIDISSINNKTKVVESLTPYMFKDAPSRAQQVVTKGDILISTVRPNLKNIAIVNVEGDNIVSSSGFCVLRAVNGDKNFLMQVLNSQSFTDYLVKLVTGANYPAVKEEDIKFCKIGVPPLSLQQEFAAKVEAIETMKEKVRQSLKEAETLFNSRMDYYFN